VTTLFPKLPLLDQLLSDSRKRNEFAEMGLVCVQHLLETTGSLFEKLIELGFRAQNIHALGKAYSTDPSVEDRLRELGIRVHPNETQFEWGKYSNQFAIDVKSMWTKAAASFHERGLSRVIALDDGGISIAAAPPNIFTEIPTIGVEQTMSGITLSHDEPPPIPYISVGSSSAKLLIEPDIIRNEVFTKVLPLVTSLRSKTVGVVGTGHIGRAIISGLQAIGANILVNDRRLGGANGLRNITECSLDVLYDRSEVIWGCAGSDHLIDKPWVDGLKGHKTLLSCSSRDVEFGTILRKLPASKNDKYIDRFADVEVKISNWTAHLIRGGFPVNFDRSNESAPLQDIQLTRALLLAGILQAAQCPVKEQSGVMITLDPGIQATIVALWFSLVPHRKIFYSNSTKAFFGVGEWAEHNVLNSSLTSGLVATTN
jgi:D-isomer specific 2-hydroxyacid dehydrogenase, NAD binding domain